MVPELLNEIHWLIENRGLSFLLTGSSVRKLRRRHANLLGGRAWRYTLCRESAATIDFPMRLRTVDGVWSMLVGAVFFRRRDGEPIFTTVGRCAKRLALTAFFGVEKG